MNKKIINSQEAPTAIGPYSQAVRINNTIYVSGQLPIDPASGSLIDGGINQQTNRILQNIAAIAKEAGAELHNVVKTTVFLTDLGNFQEMNAAYSTFFPDSPPARSTIGVAELPLGSPIEIEAILMLPE